MRYSKITKEQLFDFQKPKYNGFVAGHGPHKNKKKYNRRNKDWMKYEQNRSRNKGSSKIPKNY